MDEIELIELFQINENIPKQALGGMGFGFLGQVFSWVV